MITSATAVDHALVHEREAADAPPLLAAILRSSTPRSIPDGEEVCIILTGLVPALRLIGITGATAAKDAVTNFSDRHTP
eukprot:SAG11_NODE_482_length_9072_cov_12.361306_2_plen_79_part_00